MRRRTINELETENYFLAKSLWTWKVTALVFFAAMLFLLYINSQKYYPGEINDDYYHKGVVDCQNNYRYGFANIKFMYKANASTLCEIKLNGTIAEDGYCYYPK